MVAMWKEGAKVQIEELKGKYPETEIIVLAPAEAFVEAVRLLGLGVYDCLQYPLFDLGLLVKSLDRAVEKNFYLYQLEQMSLNEKVQAENTESLITKADEDQYFEFRNWLFGLYLTRSLDEAIGHYLDLLHKNATPGVLFRHYPHRRVLIATQSRGLNHPELSRLGINLAEENISSEQLKNPVDISALGEVAEKVLGKTVFGVRGFEIKGQTLGIFLFLPDNLSTLENPCVDLGLAALERHALTLDLETRIHQTSTKDEVTEVLNRRAILDTLNLEIARARRLQLPVSLLLLKAAFGNVEQADLCLRWISRLIGKNGRVNDILGRMGEDELALILPHTALKGAAIKAERLRRMVESADFSKIMRGGTPVSLSIGVSEYPSLARDVDELLQTADDALTEVVKTGSNRVCMAAREPGFIADFMVAESPQ